jgi:hypothetical protein
MAPDLDATLSELSRLRSAREPIVTLYLDLRWSDEHQRERVRLFVQEGIRRTLAHHLDDGPGREGLDRTLDRVQAYARELTTRAHAEDMSGLALFACEELSLWRPELLRRPFVNQLALDAFPHLLQLARLAEDELPALAAVVDRAGADVWLVRQGEVELAASEHGTVTRSDSEKLDAGTGQPRRQYERERKNERREEELAAKGRRAVQARLVALHDATPSARVVLVGISATVAAFERDLPDRVRNAVIARLPKPGGWERGGAAMREGLVEEVRRALAAHEREDEQAAVQLVVGEALRGGLGVVGPEDVVLAANEGRVHHLVVEEDFRRAGWRCDGCDALGITEGDADCPFCGGDLRTVRDLGEALVARTLAGRGRVEVVRHASRLHAYRGIGALLRQTAPTGLRGASPPWPTAPGASR